MDDERGKVGGRQGELGRDVRCCVEESSEDETCEEEVRLWKVLLEE